MSDPIYCARCEITHGRGGVTRIASSTVRQLADLPPIIAERAIACLHRFAPPAAREDCWLWTGSTTNNGYGVVYAWHDGVRFAMTAHRFALIASGVFIPVGCEACHRCDVRRCANTSHLFVGTRTDNVRDMMAKGRRSYVRGEAHHSAKLSDAEVFDIRARVAAGETYRSVARAFGIDSGYVSRLINNECRKEVTA